MAVSIVPSASGGLQPYEQIFTASGTWTKPSGVKSVEVTIVGATGGVNNSQNATSAGGYYKRYIDVSNISSVAVTVGAGGGQGSTGGSSSFGTITAPGSSSGSSTAGSWYDSAKPGTAYWSGASSIYTGYYDIWYGAAGSTNYAKTCNNGRVFVYGQGNGYNLTSADGYGWSYANNSFASNGKVVYGNGLYIKFGAGSWTQSVEYSTDGASWQGMNIPGGYYKYGLVYGPAGFLIGDSGGGITKSTDGYNWSVVSNLPSSGNTYIEATSTHYYAFIQGQSTCWRSTDGVTWTSFGLPNSTQDGFIYYGSYNNKIYFIQSNILYEIDGTTVTNKGGGYYNFQNPGSPVLVVNGGYQMLSSLGSTFTDSNLGGYPPAVASTQGWIVTRGNGWGYYFSGRYAGYDGQSGSMYHGANYAYYGSPGVTSVGNPSSGSYGYATAGSGDADGWGQGASYASMARTPGSGACPWPSGNNGNPGVVRVRWWA